MNYFLVISIYLFVLMYFCSVQRSIYMILAILTFLAMSMFLATSILNKNTLACAKKYKANQKQQLNNSFICDQKV